MRLAAIASALAIAVCLAVFGAIFLQKLSVSGQAPLPSRTAPTDGRAAAVVTADAPTLAPVAAVSSCAGNPNALGISRLVEIDTTGGPGFGFEHFKSHDFLREGEIVLMHDFQHATAEAAMDLLNDLKAGGYKIVFMQPKFAVTTIAAYDEAILKQVKGPAGGDARPTSSVVRTIGE